MSRAPASQTADWLSLAAAPTFAAAALMTAISGGGPPHAFCGPDEGWPLDGMVMMYLLMSAFHVSPWLKRRTKTDLGDH